MSAGHARDYVGMSVADFHLGEVPDPLREMGRNPENNPWIPPAADRCPVNDLPNELLAHIFTLGSFDFADEDTDVMGNGPDVPLPSPSEEGLQDEEEVGDTLPFQVLVSHVCVHWRSVGMCTIPQETNPNPDFNPGTDPAIETPALWTQINFAEELPPFTRAMTWLERSKNLPIDIEIDCSLREEETEGSTTESNNSENDCVVTVVEKLILTLDDVKVILSLISPHIGRWRGLQVEVEEFDYMQLITNTLAALPSAPLLEGLQLYHYGEVEEEDYEHFKPANLRDPFPVLFSGIAPKLTHIALWGVHIAWSAEKNTFLCNLKDLELAYHAEDVRPSWADFRQILLTSPELDTLSLRLSGPGGQPNEWYSDAPIDLVGLKNLVLAYHPAGYISPLIKHFSMPNVTSLALDFDSEDFSEFAQELATPRPGTKKSLLKGLEHLKISGLPCRDETVDVIYGQLGNLRSINLKMNDDFLSHTFFEKLYRPIPSSSSATAAFYCPNLDTLTTSGIDGVDMRLFLERREKVGIPLKRLFMSEHDDVNIGQEIWFRDQLEHFELFLPSDEETDDEFDDTDSE